MSLIVENSNKFDLAHTMNIIGSDMVTIALEIAVRKYQLESNLLLKDSILEYKKLEVKQAVKLAGIAKYLIMAHVDTIKSFNSVSPYLKGVYAKGFNLDSEWSTSMVLRHNSSDDTVVIRNFEELFCHYHKFYPKGAPLNQLNYIRSQYNSQDMDKIRSTCSRMIKAANNFLSRLN